MLGLKSYLLKQNLHPEAVNLFIHHFLRSVGGTLLGIFGAIFLFQAFGHVNAAFIYYLLLFLIYALALPWTMKIVNNLGFKKSMIISLFLFISFYICFSQIMNSSKPWIWIVIALPLHVSSIALYWIPFHTDFALLTEKKNRGKNLALLSGAIALISILLPFISSIIITYLGFLFLFMVIIFFIALSGLYLKKIPKIEEKFTYSVKQTYQKLFAKKNRRMFIAYFSDGVQSVATSILWPLFIFLLLDKNYLSVGIISTLIISISVIFRIIIGDLADKYSKKKLVKFISVLHSIGWVIKVFVQTPFQIFSVGAYHSFIEPANKVTFHSLMYERAADQGHYLDEYTVLRDMAMCLGKSFILLLALLLVGTIGINWLFLIAALASLFLSIL